MTQLKKVLIWEQPPEHSCTPVPPAGVCQALFTLTPSAFSSVLASISWSARTDSDCSNTKVQMDRSGGTFWKSRNKSDVDPALEQTTTTKYCRIMSEWEWEFWKFLLHLVSVPNSSSVEGAYGPVTEGLGKWWAISDHLNHIKSDWAVTPWY